MKLEKNKTYPKTIGIENQKNFQLSHTCTKYKTRGNTNLKNKVELKIYEGAGTHELREAQKTKEQEQKPTKNHDTQNPSKQYNF